MSSICVVCSIEISNSLLSCGCSVCSTCQAKWILSVNNNAYINLTYPCANHTCKIQLSQESIKAIMNGEYLSQLQEIMLRKYILNDLSTFYCPNNRCNYAGFVDPNIKCKDKFICSSCNNEFIIDSAEVDIDALKKSLPVQIVVEVFTHIKAELENLVNLQCRDCPKCNSKIYRTQGCSHMTCSVCSEYFCWTCGVCLHDQSHDYYHSMKFSILSLSAFFFCILLFLKLYYSIKLVSSACDLILWIILSSVSAAWVLCKYIIVILIFKVKKQTLKISLFLIFLYFFDAYSMIVSTTVGVYWAFYSIYFIITWSIYVVYYCIIGVISFVLVQEYVKVGYHKAKVVAWLIVFHYLTIIFNMIIGFL